MLLLIRLIDVSKVLNEKQTIKKAADRNQGIALIFKLKNRLVV
ncbi:hypothetical protein HMPREF9088_2229 [Enterococcus italicus DSM 15952]|uniref:Uncharacterized protein n=1 Tax=Enterococcus italicus (strain DSM 15952 / CCUG 50447 / LMG 22039 / TP 1.5) TaxID=888064 RepID=E6LIN9_ENTI1|nr:hypothetical protein HMPREF9088_2229 [Enterococcus italicus DSM 15952]